MAGLWHAWSKVSPCMEEGPVLTGLGQSPSRAQALTSSIPKTCVRIMTINKYQHNTKFCIFIACPLTAQTHTLCYSLRRPVLSCEPALLQVQSSVKSISHAMTRATYLSPAVPITHLKPCWAKWLICCILLWSLKKITCLPSHASTWPDSFLQEQSIFPCCQPHP